MKTLLELLINKCEYRLPNEFLSLNNDEKFQFLCNIREPKKANEELLKLQDEYLHVKTLQRGIVDVEKFEYKDNIALWQGDITRLNSDVIVNACNAKLLGCFQPLHNCIDNVIHTNAGIQVRCDCEDKMKGKELPNGEIVVTSAYNLPSSYIFHTVGPIVANSKVTPLHVKDLRSCYINSLEKAKEMGLKNITFCCISTGTYGYPKHEACQLAVSSVKEWLRENENLKVIFNVFGDEDRKYYEKELSKKN